MTCLIDNTFDVGNLAHKSALDSILSKIEKEKVSSAKDLVNKIKAAISTDPVLKNTGYNPGADFTTQQLREYNKIYRESVKSLGDYILAHLKLKNTYPNGIKEELTDSLKKTSTDKNPWESVILVLSELSEFDTELNSENYNKASENFFKESKVTSGYYNELNFKRQFFDNCIIIKSKFPTLVTTNEKLNSRITYMQKNLGDKLKKIVPGFENIELAYKKNDLNRSWDLHLENMYNLMKAAKDEVAMLTSNPNFFLQGYQDIMDGKENVAYDAVCAYFSLFYFDDLLEQSVGNFIAFDKSLKNKFTPSSLNKYNFSLDTKHHRHNFSQDSDAMTVEQNTALFTKLIIETIPISIGTNKVVSKYLSTVSLSDSICKLKSIGSQIEGGKFDRTVPNTNIAYLQYCIDNYRNDPISYASIIFKLLTSKKVKDALMQFEINGKQLFTTTDFSIYKAVYDNVYSDENGSLSRALSDENFRKIEDKAINDKYEKLKETNPRITKQEVDVTDEEIESARKKVHLSRNISTYDPVSCISVFFNDCVPIDMIDTEIDLEGNTEIKQREKSKVNQGVFFKADCIDYGNNMRNLSLNEYLIKNNDDTRITSLGNDKKLSDITINDKGVGISIVYNGNNKSIFNEGQDFSVKIVKTGSESLNLQEKGSNKGTQLNAFTEMLNNYISGKSSETISSLLKWIDDRLFLGISTEEGKLKLKILIENNSDVKEIFRDMIKSALRAQVTLELKSLKPETSTFESFLKTFNGFKDTAFKRNTKKGFAITMTRIIKPGTSSWLDAWETAELIFKGYDLKSVSKNFFGKNESNYSKSFLGANPRHQARQYFDEQIKVENSANNFIFEEGPIVDSVKTIFNSHRFNKNVTLNNIQNFFTDKNVSDITDEERETLLKAFETLKEEYYKTNYKETAASANYFTKHPKALGQTVVKTVAKNQLGKPKFIKDMNTGELLYDSFVHSFCGASRKNEILVQCTTFSDKTKFVHSKISLSHVLNSGVNLNMATIEQIQDEYLETVGKSLKITLENTRILYGKLLTEFAKERNLNLKFDTIEEINQTLGNFESKELLKNLNRIATKLGEKFFADTHYVITKSKSGLSIVQLNPLLVYQANTLYADNKEQFKKRWLLQEELFIKGIIDSGIQFKVPDSIRTDKDEEGEALTSLLRKYPIITGVFKLNHNKDKKDSDFYNEYAKQWIKNGQLILGKKPDGTDITYADKNLSGIKLNPLLEKFFGLDTLLSANLRILYTGTELAHPYKKATGNAVALNFTNIEGYENLSVQIKSDLQELSNADNMNGIINYLDTKKSKNLDLIKDLIKEIVHERALNIENSLQGIQLKRNVIIPATMSYVNPNLKEGVSQTTKVAIIKDIQANVWEFVKRGKPVDSMDGSALTCPLQSILENNSLKSNAVGHDKKPIWQSYDGHTNSATFVKFASFEMTNQRLRDSIMSDVSLLNVLKRMYGIRWSDKYNWSENPILCGNTGYNNGERVSFKNMTNGKPLIYRDTDGNYKLILDLTFEWVDENDHSKGFVYKTTESYVDENTGSISGSLEMYHLFNNNSNHIKLTKDEFEADKDNLLNSYHTIDSLFDLWNVLGGCYTYDFKNGDFIGNELSHQVLANYVNNIAIPTFTSLSDLGKVKSVQELNESQLVYKQPLKEMFIGYIANTSAVKNGQGNVNELSAWSGNEELNYIELDNTNLGIQMDADHEMANSEMTEFSQVITALEANGRTHHLSKEIYYTLGRIATNASKIELESLDLFKLHPELSKNQVYDVLSKSIIQHSKLNGNRVSLAEVLIQRLEREFGTHLTDHDKDEFKLPFSDSSIYSLILPTFASSINSKSIKRKFPGSGCVMCPGYNIMQVFKFKEGDTDLVLTADDILDRIKRNKKLKSKDAKEEIYKQYGAIDDTSKRRALIDWYLNNKQLEQKEYTLDEFGPTDIIDIRDDKGNYLDSLSLDDINVYYKFIENRDQYIKDYLTTKGISTEGLNFKYRHSATKPRNLAPARITWNYNYEENGVPQNKKYNLFELNAFKECFRLDKAINESKDKNETKLLKKQYSLARLAAQRQLNVIAKGLFYINGGWNEDMTSWLDGNLVQCENLKNEPAELIVSNMYAEKFGIKNKSVGSILKRGVKDFMITPQASLPQTKFDLCFRKTNGEDVLVTFDKVDKSNGTYQPWEHKDLVYTNNKNGTIEVHLKDKNGNPKFLIGRLMPTDKYEYYEDETGNKYFIDKATRKKVDNKNLRNLKSGIYEYKEFISKYNTTKVDSTDNFGEIIRDITVYKINRKSIEDSMVFIKEVPDKIKRFNINSAIAKRMKDLYESENFLGIEISNELNYSSASSLIPIFEHVDYNDNWKNTVGDKIVEILKNKINDVNTSLKDDKKKVKSEIKINLDNEANLINRYYVDYYDQNALERFNSWKASLYFTAARIPAQSHQSFMQMKTVAYSGSDKNICYVSHWQTFLQGSDYDIDKAYLMGCNIGDDGKYTKWSNLFDYSTEETLKASQKLPVADNCNVYEGEGGFDISEYVKKYELNSASWNNVQKLNWIADLLYDLEDFRKNHKDKDVHITNANNDEVILMLRKHYGTKLSDELQDAAYKNFVSSNIQNTIQDPRNFISAYTPISMDDLQDAAKDSSKAQATRNLNLMNPATKWIMQTQNMTGKTVIGITAVGEKIYFNMCFLWNEALNRAAKGDYSKMKYVKFNQTFNRIQGRFYGEPQLKTVQFLADVNIDNLSVEQLHLMFDESTLIQYSINSGLNKEPKDFTKEDFDNMIHTQLGVDIMISQLLSAATDNAKELILEKINCDSNFAKYYLHLLMMGFDIKDCVKYMTSGAVETITELTKTNFFDSQQEEVPTWVALSEAKFKIYPNRYIKGEVVRSYDEDDDSTYDEEDFGSSKPNSRASKFTEKISITYEDTLNALKILKDKGATDEQINKLLEKIVESKNEATDKVIINPITAFIVTQLISDKPASLSTFILNKSTGKPAKLAEDEQICVNRIDYIVNKVKSKLSDTYTIFDYLDDIDQFTELDDLANETSNVGNTFLGMNQGIPTDKDGLVSKLNSIEETVLRRLKNLIPQAYKLGTSEYKNADKNDPKFDDIVEILVANSGTDKGEVKRILKLAIAYGICDDFDAEKWLYDIKLDEKSLVNKYIIGDKNIIVVLPTTYRKLIMEFYNLLKLTWNPFYAMSELPQFSAIVDLLAVEALYDIESSAKSNIISSINDDLRNKGIKIKKENLSKFRPYADKLLLDGFLNDNPVLFVLPPTIGGLKTNYFKTDGKLESVDHPVELNMSLQLDRASLKMYVEDILIPYMKSEPTFKDMQLIKDLNVAINRNGSSSLQVPIDLSDPHSSNESTKTFAKYQQNINELGKYTIPDNPKLKVVDILMLYNLIVNCNKYGSNRLTGLFLSYVLNNENCLLRDYYKWLGNLDFNNSRDLLTILNYERSDALLEVAETVRENRLIDYDKNKIAKVYDKNKMRYVYKSYNRKSNTWKEVNYYGNRKLSELSEGEVNLFTQHWVNMLPKASQIAENYLNIAYDDKVSNVMAALRYFLNIGKLTIIKDNCE